jgi:hypothetical protein
MWFEGTTFLDVWCLQAVLSGSLRSPLMGRWHPTMLPYGLSLIGAMAADYLGDLPGRLLALMQQWQAAALAALQPAIASLPAASYVQLLLACSRLKLAGGGSRTDSVEQLLQGADADDMLESVIAVSIQVVSRELDQLEHPELLIQLLQGLAKLDGASQSLGSAIMGKLYPHLG